MTEFIGNTTKVEYIDRYDGESVWEVCIDSGECLNKGQAWVAVSEYDSPFRQIDGEPSNYICFFADAEVLRELSTALLAAAVMIEQEGGQK